MSTGVKICGITNLQDAQDAIAAGADFLGFIFVPSSNRAVDEARARQILPAIRGKAKVVGVFKNNPLEEVNRLSQELQLDFVQLHGSESPEYSEAVNAPVIKVIEIGEESDSAALAESVAAYKNCKYILFDKPKGVQLNDWIEFALDQVAGIDSLGDYFFAGGLNHSNVSVALQRISPTFVDVASGVEKAPGLKDMTKMIAFCNSVKNKQIVPEEAVS